MQTTTVNRKTASWELCVWTSELVILEIVRVSGENVVYYFG